MASNEAAPSHHPGKRSSAVLAFMPFACMLLFAGRKKFGIMPKLMLLLVGAAVSAATLTGCGSYNSSYTNPTTSTTPTGTTAVTVTATSGAVSHTSTINLTVQ